MLSVEMGGLPPINSVLLPAGRSSNIFCRPVLPSGKANVRSETLIVGKLGIVPLPRREIILVAS